MRKIPFRLPRLNFQAKVTLLIGWSMLAIAVVTSFSVYTVAMNEAIEQLGERLKAVVITGALKIDGDMHKMLTNPNQMDTGAYRYIQSYLRQLRDSNTGLRLRFAYTMMPTDKPGIWAYGVDAEPMDSKDFSMLGEREDFTYDPRWMHVITSPFADVKLKRYKFWGRLLSASAPILDRNKKSVAVLSVDAEPDDVVQALIKLKYWGLGSVGLGLVLSIFLSLLLARHVTKPVDLLVKATQEVAKGNFDQKVNLSKRQELSGLADAFNQMTEGLRERELLKYHFERYVGQQVAKKIFSDPDRKFLRAERKRVTILFCDIRGFTKMAANRDPEVVIQQLNEFFSEMIDIIFHFEGTLDKFMGDAVMAIFGAPFGGKNDEWRSVSAAIAMQKKVADLNRSWAARGLEAYQVGIGLNTGDAVVGNVGSEKRLEYSAIGDTVNTAARLENLNRERNTKILISESTYEAVKDQFEMHHVGTEILRGHDLPVSVYEVVGEKNLVSIEI